MFLDEGNLQLHHPSPCASFGQSVPGIEALRRCLFRHSTITGVASPYICPSPGSSSRVTTSWYGLHTGSTTGSQLPLPPTLPSLPRLQPTLQRLQHPPRQTARLHARGPVRWSMPNVVPAPLFLFLPHQLVQQWHVPQILDTSILFRVQLLFVHRLVLSDCTSTNFRTCDCPTGPEPAPEPNCFLRLSCRRPFAPIQLWISLHFHFRN